MFAIEREIEPRAPMAVPKVASGGTRVVMGAELGEAIALMEWARLKAGISASEVARRLGVTPQTIGEYREQRRPRIGWLFMARWLRVCGFRVVLEQVE